MKLLFLTSRMPWPPDRGDRLRTYHMLENICLDHEITLVSFISSREEAEQKDFLKSYCQEIYLVHQPQWRSTLSVGINMWRGLPMQLNYYRSRKMQSLIDDLTRQRSFDAAYIHLFRMAPYMGDHPKLYRIVDLTDVISREMKASLPYRKGLSQFIYRYEQSRIAEYERMVGLWADDTWIISEHDKSELDRFLPEANLQVIPNGVDLDRFFPIDEYVNDNQLIFVGNINVFHNIDALRFLVLEILPMVREELPNTKLTIVGAGDVQRIRELVNQPGVEFAGYLEDLNKVLNEAALFVAPLRFSAGIQNKVLEAMAAGLPTVVTSSVNAGLGAEPGREIVVADQAQAIAQAIVRLMGEADLRNTIGRAGRRFVESRFSWNIAVQRMRQIEQIIDDRRRTVVGVDN